MENPIQITFDVHIRCCGEVWNFNQISALFSFFLHKFLILHVLIVMKKKSMNWKTSESESRTFKIRFVRDLRSHYSCEWDFRFFRRVIKNMENSWKQWNCFPWNFSFLFRLDLCLRHCIPPWKAQAYKQVHKRLASSWVEDESLFSFSWHFPFPCYPVGFFICVSYFHEYFCQYLEHISNFNFKHFRAHAIIYDFKFWV